MTVYLLHRALFDGDGHPSHELLSAHLSEAAARAAAAQHLSENPTVVRYAYGGAGPNGSVIAVISLRELATEDGPADYLIVPLEVLL